jgi:tetratricopeptide (TPR) repeat protein
VRSDADKALVEEISHHPLIIGKNTALSQRAATICYYIQGFCATAKVDKQNALKNFMKVRDILDKNPLIRQDLPKRYMRALSSMMAIHIDLGNLDEAEALIASMRHFTTKDAFDTEDIASMTFRETYLGELKIYERRGDFQSALKIVDDIVVFLDESNARINKEYELHFMNGIASVYFGAGMYKEALQWLNRVLNDNETNLRQDVYSYARLFNLVVHYELGNYDLLEYIIKSTFRYLSKRHRDHQLEVTILAHMKRLARQDSESETIEIFKQFRQELNECLKKESNQIILSHFNYPVWIESKIRNISFEEAAKIKYRDMVQV